MRMLWLLIRQPPVMASEPVPEYPTMTENVPVFHCEAVPAARVPDTVTTPELPDWLASTPSAVEVMEAPPPMKSVPDPALPMLMDVVVGFSHCDPAPLIVTVPDEPAT